LILRRVGVADERRVVPPDDRAVERRTDALIGLCADDDESPHTKAGQHRLEGGFLEGVGIALADERLGVVRRQLGDDPPVVAPRRKSLAGVLDPDDGDIFLPRLVDQAADVPDDRVALVRALDHAVLHVDDEECGVRTVIECAHGPPWSVRPMISIRVAKTRLARSPKCLLEPRVVAYGGEVVVSGCVLAEPREQLD